MRLNEVSSEHPHPQKKNGLSLTAGNQWLAEQKAPGTQTDCSVVLPDHINQVLK